MSNLTPPQHELSASHSAPEAKQAENHSQASSDNHSGISEPSRHAEETSDRETEHGHGSKLSSHFDSEDGFFADAPAQSSATYQFPPQSREAKNAAEESAPSPAASSRSHFGHQLMVVPADAERADQEASNRATSGPLSLDEEHSQSSDYSPHQQESSPAQHILPAPGQEQNGQSDSGQLEHSVFEPAAQEPAVDEVNERIPTLPPPNREALSGIAFLMPPQVQVDATPSEPSAETVDALVQKVLEKLRPQLQDMFSQGVKPLVENLVHSELSKKDR
jgi:hypothetical protein